MNQPCEVMAFRKRLRTLGYEVAFFGKWLCKIAKSAQSKVEKLPCSTLIYYSQEVCERRNGATHEEQPAAGAPAAPHE